MDLPIRALVSLSVEERARIEGLVRRLSTLHDLVMRGLAHSPPLVVSDVVVQDEFTHDVIVPLGPARFLVFDTT